VTTSTEAGSTSCPAQGKSICRRIVSRDLLTAMERSNPLEAALAHLLVKEGAWALAE